MRCHDEPVRRPQDSRTVWFYPRWRATFEPSADRPVGDVLGAIAPCPSLKVAAQRLLDTVPLAILFDAKEYSPHAQPGRVTRVIGTRVERDPHTRRVTWNQGAVVSQLGFRPDWNTL